jgi:hypothetical protein
MSPPDPSGSPGETLLPPAEPTTDLSPPAGRSGRRWLRWGRVLALVVALPVAALVIGLLIAWVVHEIRGTSSTGTPAPAPAPSIPAIPTAHPSTAAPRVVVPADWIVETQPPAGLTFRYPTGWIHRTALPEVLRFAPAAVGSTTPGVEGIGAGIERNADPAAALQQFVTRAYGGQPQVVLGPVTPVTGARPGERQQVVTYARAGVPVRVVVHAFGSGGESVIVLARAANAEPARSTQLEAAVEASLQISG